MKKLFLLAVALLLSVFVFAQKSKIKAKYYYAVAWEYLPMPDQSETNIQPLVSNVFALRCREDKQPNKTGITNELNDYYKAYLSKRRGFNGINRAIAFGPFDTWEEAEKQRRKSIVDYNRDWEPILLRDFSAACD